MQVSTEWVRTMARYNAWQNDGLRKLVPDLADGEAVRDRGAFFGSILGTLNHVLWGDRVWMSRLAGHPAPGGGIADSAGLTASVDEWSAGRFVTDRAILHWSYQIKSLDLVGELRWMSGAAGQQMARPIPVLITHLFNHQTHHRGQVHAMLTAAGCTPPDTDLMLMAAPI